jgi:radical SAM protein with 4Fe4S-binding SPASM domain
MTIELGSYVDFSALMGTASVQQRIPMLGTIEVSHRCPLNCAHCYNNLPMSDMETARKELSYEELCRVLDELADLGCMWLLFTGGEIFARRDFLDVYTYAKRKGFIITLFTNGTLISTKIADHLVKYRPFHIEITLYGRTRETYERLTRIPGSYDRCMNGIRLLKERGLPLALKTAVTSINRHEVADMKRFAEEEIGVPFKLDAMINPRTDCSAAPLAVRLSPEEVVSIDLEEPARRAEWQKFATQFTIPVHPSAAGQVDAYACGGGVNSFAIDPLGEMTICVISHAESYNVRKGSVKEGWEHFLRTVRTRKATRVTKCTYCQIKSMCGMCPATAQLENGDPEEPVDFLCHTAHLRAYTFNLPVPAHGECQYCVGGSDHAVLREEADRLNSQAPSAPRQAPLFLPSAAASPLSGGCLSGCSLPPAQRDDEPAVAAHRATLGVHRV